MTGKGKSPKNTKSDIFYALNKFYDSILKYRDSSYKEEGKYQLLLQLHREFKLFLEEGDYTNNEETKLIAQYKNMGLSNSDISNKLDITGNSTVRIRITRFTKKAYEMLFASDDFPEELFHPEKLDINDIQGYLKRISVAAVDYNFEEQSNPELRQLLKNQFRNLGINTTSDTILTETSLARIVNVLAVYSSVTMKKAIEAINPYDLKSVYKDLVSKKKNEATTMYNAILASGVDLTPQLSQELIDKLKDLGKNVTYLPPAKKEIIIEQDVPAVPVAQVEPESTNISVKQPTYSEEDLQTIEQLKEEIEYLKTQVADKDFTISNLKTQQQSDTSTFTRLKANIEALEESKQKLEQNNKVLKKQLHDLEVKLKSPYDKDLGYLQAQKDFGTQLTRVLLSYFSRGNHIIDINSSQAEQAELAKALNCLDTISLRGIQAYLRKFDSRVLEEAFNKRYSK